MVSRMDFKDLFEKYQRDGAKNGISIVNYCQMNGVVYSHFERWCKKYRAGVVNLTILILLMIGKIYAQEAFMKSLLYFLLGRLEIENVPGFISKKMV